MKETLLLQMEWEERLGQYKALIRQAFARKASVLLLVPTNFDLEKVKKEVSKGIEEFVFTLEERVKAAKEKHPILFISTPAGLLFERKDLGTYIVERENSRAYRTLARPYIDFRVVVETVAKETGRQLVLGDSVLSIENLWRARSGQYGESSLIRWRLVGAPTTLVDVRHIGEYFQIISKELKDFVAKALGENQKIFLYGARKGLFPTTVCGDCGTMLPCLNCGAPVVLHQRSDLKDTQGRTLYVCHSCGDKRESNIKCGHCGSWKLVPLGIGTEEIAWQVKLLYPEKSVAILDSEHRKPAKNWDILVGTEKAFFHLQSIPYSAIVSADALFSVPDFAVHERIFYLVSRLREMTERECLIQTRNIGKQILGWVTSGNIIDFYNSEIALRDSFAYPPFSIFIKIIGEKIPAELFLKWQPEQYKNSLIIRLKRESWPDKELSYQLSLLPPQFMVKVDPETIL